MRVKIKGEITIHQLAKALRAATEKYEGTRPGHKIFGANLYLTAFDANGAPFDLRDERGESLVITIDAPPGGLVRPPMTAEDRARREREKAENRRRWEEAKAREAAEQKARAEQQRRYYEREQQLKADARARWEQANALTAELMQTMPERFVAELNGAVRDVWNALKPLEKIGANKGQPKAIPVFSIHPDGLLLSVATWKKPRIMENPICQLERGRLAPLWRYDAWQEATRRMIVVMKGLSDSTMDADEAMHGLVGETQQHRYIGVAQS